MPLFADVFEKLRLIVEERGRSSAVPEDLNHQMTTVKEEIHYSMNT